MTPNSLILYYFFLVTRCWHTALKTSHILWGKCLVYYFILSAETTLWGLFYTVQVVTSEPRPHRYENTALPRTYYEFASETSPQNYYDRTNYRSVRNGKNASTLMHIFFLRFSIMKTFWAIIEVRKEQRFGRNRFWTRRLGILIQKWVAGRCENKEQWKKIRICMIKYKEKWERVLRQNESGL